MIPVLPEGGAVQEGRCGVEEEEEEGCSEEAEQMLGQLKGSGECDECGQSVKVPCSHAVSPEIYVSAWRGRAETR